MPELECGEPPKAGVALWEAFMDLSFYRPSGMGPSAIPLAEIEAWCRINRVQLTPWELSAIRAMDSAVLAVWAAQRNK